MITFDDWEQVLKARVPPDRYHAYREAIVKFRHWLRKTNKIPSVEAFKLHLEWKQSYLDPDRFAIRREALRWYYLEGRKRMTVEKASSPKKTLPVEDDQGSRSNPPPKNERKPTLPPPSGTQPMGTISKIGEYRVYSMNDVPTDGARDLGGPEWEQNLVRRDFPLISPRDGAFAAHLR